MPMVRWLALLPFLGMLVGPFFVNRVAPYILGMPFLLAWFVAWILITAAIVAVIFRYDPANWEERE
jgi:xanthosine utilization system XapX-like protein